MDHTCDREKKKKPQAKFCNEAVTQKETPAPALILSQTTFIRTLRTNIIIL